MHLRAPEILVTAATASMALPETSGVEDRSLSRDARDARLFSRLAKTGDPRAREELIERYMPLARNLAARYRKSSEPFDDLLQVASLGLVKAVDRYEPGRGIAFSSYAVPTITGELKRHFRDKSWSVRMPRGLQERTLRVDKAVTQLNTDLGRSPTVTELASTLELSEEEVLEALEARHAHSATSLETPLGGEEDDARTLGDGLGHTDDGFELAEHRATLKGLFDVLPERDQRIVRMRFEDGLTQAEIGKVVGVSQMQVSRILRASLAKMHAAARDVRFSTP
jgi:RNA polymerase sigma-B factor